MIPHGTFPGELLLLLQRFSNSSKISEVVSPVISPEFPQVVLSGLHQKLFQRLFPGILSTINNFIPLGISQELPSGILPGITPEKSLHEFPGISLEIFPEMRSWAFKTSCRNSSKNSYRNSYRDFIKKNRSTSWFCIAICF